MAKVTVYSKKDCNQCDSTIRLMDREGIEYDLIKVDEQPEAAQTVKELGYLSVPVVVTEESHWYGFRPDFIKALV